jgi:hypothetical protein
MSLKPTDRKWQFSNSPTRVDQSCSLNPDLTHKGAFVDPRVWFLISPDHRLTRFADLRGDLRLKITSAVVIS